jgi:hypothetical protein
MNRRQKAQAKAQRRRMFSGDAGKIQLQAGSAHTTGKLTSPLFHYTTSAGLIGIVKDQMLFATHANYLNDTAELKLLSGLLWPSISEELKEIVPRLIDVGAFLPELLQVHGEHVYATEAANICRSIIKAIEVTSPILI